LLRSVALLLFCCIGVAEAFSPVISILLHLPLSLRATTSGAGQLECFMQQDAAGVSGGGRRASADGQPHVYRPHAPTSPRLPNTLEQDEPLLEEKSLLDGVDYWHGAILVQGREYTISIPLDSEAREILLILMRQYDHLSPLASYFLEKEPKFRWLRAGLFALEIPGEQPPDSVGLMQPPAPHYVNHSGAPQSPPLLQYPSHRMQDEFSPSSTSSSMSLQHPLPFAAPDLTAWHGKILFAGREYPLTVPLGLDSREMIAALIRQNPTELGHIQSSLANIEPVLLWQRTGVFLLYLPSAMHPSAAMASQGNVRSLHDALLEV
jgi:hypothetical protein